MVFVVKPSGSGCIWHIPLSPDSEVPGVVTHLSSGSVEFRVFRPSADRVELLGTFTDWRQRAVSMQKEPSGWFVARLAVEPGDHEFQYLIDGTEWIADYGASGVSQNGYGLWVSALFVPEPETRRIVVETRPVKPGLNPAPGGILRPARAA